MKEQTIYVASDGSRFDESEACVEYEAECLEIARALEFLKPIPQENNSNFANGAGFVRQTPVDVLTCQSRLANIVRKKFKDPGSRKHIDWVIDEATKPAGHTFISRLISDGCGQAMNRAWSRISCISEDFREFGQPYFASNPDKADQRDLTA